MSVAKAGGRATGKKNRQTSGNRSRTPHYFSADSIKASLPNENVLISDKNKLTRAESRRYHPKMKIGSPMAQTIQYNQQFFLLCITGECGKAFNIKNIKKATQLNGDHCRPTHPNINIKDIKFLAFSWWSV